MEKLSGKWTSKELGVNECCDANTQQTQHGRKCSFGIATLLMSPALEPRVVKSERHRKGCCRNATLFVVIEQLLRSSLFGA